jgi:hypothetical protein
MTAHDDDILDSLFHGCALAAFVEQAIAQGGPPDREATRRLAYEFYETALGEKNGRKSAAALDPTGTLSTPANGVPVD